MYYLESLFLIHRIFLVFVDLFSEDRVISYRSLGLLGLGIGMELSGADHVNPI